MSTYSRIRDQIPNVDSAKTFAEIAALLPDVKRQAIRAAVSDMVDCKVIDRVEDQVTGYRYHVIRAVKLRAYATVEESKEARRVRDRGYAKRRGRRIGERRAGVRTLEEWRAERALSKATRLQRIADERAAKRQQRAADRAAIVHVAAPTRAGAKRSLAQRMLANEPHESVRLREAPPVKNVPAETIEQWMARTGQRPQVLPVAWNEVRGM